VSEYRFIPPCSPIRAKEVPAGDSWLHEVKFDGYRMQAHKVGSRVTIYSPQWARLHRALSFHRAAAARAPSQIGSA